MNERPTAVELLEAVRELLAGKVLTRLTEPPLKFQALVASHVLGVLERELSRDPAQEARLREERERLLGAAGDDSVLCEAIEQGHFDDEGRRRALHGYLLRRVEASVAVWNPSFLPRARATPPA
ncbi:MAG: hypothetical protein HY909_19340 [Deltaproteobacteria bacterium]|nr:hypothetical protein [Deltaproteobacteria bacterium]